MCNQAWMKHNCKKMCGLCAPPSEDDEASFASPSDKETSAPKRKYFKTFFLALHTLLYNYFFDRIFFRNHSSYRLKNLDCEYSGVVHQSGETWSPGPCVPKCHCDNGHIKCSKLECPDLNCDKPVKRRWKCCPECLPNANNGMFYHCSYYILYIHILLLIQWTVDQREP